MTHKTEHFTGIEDFPAHRWHDLQLALMVEAGAGGGVEGLESLILTAYRHLEGKEPEKTAACLVNALQNIGLAKERISQLPIAYAATVRTIDGRDVSGFSAEQVAAILEDKQTPLARFAEFVGRIKKKLISK